MITRQPPGELLEYVEAVRATLPARGVSPVSFFVRSFAPLIITAAMLEEDRAFHSAAVAKMQAAMLASFNIPRDILWADNVSSSYSSRHHQATKTAAPADRGSYG